MLQQDDGEVTRAGDDKVSAPPTRDQRRWRRIWTTGVVLACLLGVAVYGGLVVWRDAGSIAMRLRTFAWWTFAAACGLSLANYGLRFLKWEYYLRVLGIRGVPKGESLLIFLSGFVIYFVARAINRRRGVDIDRRFKEIPVE